jgi:hypothetical protein
VATLEDYLSADFSAISQEIDTLTGMINRAADTFVVTFKDGSWPYGYNVRTEEATGGDAVSQGTLAMVLCAVGKLLGKCRMEGLSVEVGADQLDEDFDLALETLANAIDAVEPSREGLPPAHFRSRTFGNDSMMTLSHVADLDSALFASLSAKPKGLLKKSLRAVNKRLEKKLESAIIDPVEGNYRATAFILLRACRAFEVADLPQPPGLRFFFESRLHDQLSFSTIPDSRFDPGELLYSLEGLLLCAPEAIDDALFDRVIQVLADKQNTSAHWRSSTPFVASATGYIMLPLSVEGANSFMRSLLIMDRERRYNPVTPKVVPLLSRFWRWLQARAVRFEKNGASCVGWHSEHVNEPTLIHTWDTSQVVEFMIAYRAALHRDVAHQTLQLSGVKVRAPQPLVASLPSWKATSGQATPTWADVETDREPLLSADEGRSIYRSVGSDLVEPRSTGTGKRYFSMLLYGPPGTGKSTLAKLLADALGWPMLTVTASDFLGTGGAMVEARAKAVFQMLEAQWDCVILFDEIDAFLLDRDSEFYRQQETLFKFLTPGMLTKINDLRAAKRSIFVIATNYANRIDPAIKRVGRIDTQLLLLPPDLQRRRTMVGVAIKQERKRNPALKALSAAKIEAAARASLYLGWTDIADAVRAWAESGADIALEVAQAERSTGPEFYGRRFPREQPFTDQPTGEEAEALYQLAVEVEKDQWFSDAFFTAATAVDSEAANAALLFLETIGAPAPKAG